MARLQTFSNLQWREQTGRLQEQQRRKTREIVMTVTSRTRVENGGMYGLQAGNSAGSNKDVSGGMNM